MQNNSAKAVYAAYAKDESLRMASSSGAVFSLLAEQILSREGVVYGVAMSLDCKSAEFIRVDTIDDLFKLRGSKYLQARVGSTYNRVKKDLEVGFDVLFSGVGCQINGLKAFLNKTYDNLFCVDVICHGVPSPALWKKYVEYMEKQNESQMVSVNFRCKDDSWQNFGMKELGKDKKEVYISKDIDPFMQMFLRNYCLRPSCYDCTAKKVKMSDVTIADFWGIERVASDMNDGRGTSLVLIRNKKGEEMFEFVKDRLKYRNVSYEDGVRGNPTEYQSVARPKERAVFFHDMDTLAFSALQEKYAAPISFSVVQRIKRKLRKVFSVLYNRHLRVYRTYFWGGAMKSNANYGMLYQFENQKKYKSGNADLQS